MVTVMTRSGESELSGSQVIQVPGDPATGASSPLDHGVVTHEKDLQSIRRKRRLWIHCSFYLIVNGVLLMLWQVHVATTGNWSFWPILPLVGWGVGVGIHAAVILGTPSAPVTEADIREAMQQSHRG